MPEPKGKAGIAAEKPLKVATVQAPSNSDKVNFIKLALVLTIIALRMKVDLILMTILTNMIVTNCTQFHAKGRQHGWVNSGQTPSVRRRTCLPNQTQGE